MNILLPTDLQPITDSIARAFKWLSKAGKNQVHLAHVLDPSIYALGDISGNIVMHHETLELESQRAEAMLEELQLECAQRFPYVTFSSEVLMGSIEERLHELEEEKNFDLIISSTDGTHSFMRSLQGSITGNLSRKLQTPILALPIARPLPEPLQTLVIAHEFLDESEQADWVQSLQFFSLLNKLFDRIILAEIVLDSTQALRSREAMKRFANENNLQVDEFYTPLNDELEDGLASCMDGFSDALLCLGNHQNTGFKYFLEGCTAADLINRFDRPLLSFPLRTKNDD